MDMRVIAVESFTDEKGEWHQYGHEFVMADTPERARLLKKGTIREDDRMKKRLPEAKPSAQ